MFSDEATTLYIRASYASNYIQRGRIFTKFTAFEQEFVQVILMSSVIVEFAVS